MKIRFTLDNLKRIFASSFYASCPRYLVGHPGFHMKTGIWFLKWIPAFAGMRSDVILLMNSLVTEKCLMSVN